MQIVNYIKDSTIECSPFIWGLTLFCHGCNFQCSMCKGYNYEKVTDPENIIGKATDIIKSNITPLHDCVVFLGGEPTIWGDKLKEALQLCHSLNLKTKIFSNGFNHELIEQINKEGLCDAWSIDFKLLNNIQQEIGVPAQEYLVNLDMSIFDIIRHELPLEIRTTYYSGNKDQRESIEDYINKTYKSKYDKLIRIEQEDVRCLL